MNCFKFWWQIAKICTVVILKHGSVLTEAICRNKRLRELSMQSEIFCFVEKFHLRNDKIDGRGIGDIAVKDLGLQYIV